MLCFFFLVVSAFAQGNVSIIYDAKHLQIVNENGFIRTSAEMTNNSYLESINNRLNDININLGAVTLIQNIIHKSLSQVDGAVRTGLAIQQIGSLLREIIGECKSIAITAKGEPYLILFAQDVIVQTKSRSMNLAAEVSDFILREGKNVLMDYGKRDALLNKITLELRVIRGLSYSLQRAMVYAKQRGILASVNPFHDFINQDVRLVNDIIFNVNMLK